MKEIREKIISIAGFDPSGGAGILADIKTFEAHKTIGFGVTTCITIQNENEFTSCEWLSGKLIQSQLEILLKIHKINFVKIGLIQNLDMLEEKIDILYSHNESIKIIWDPILKASAGFEFYKPDRSSFEKIASKLFLITPNYHEIKTIYPDLTPEEGAKQLASFCNVLLKGGHNPDNPGRDILFEKDKQQSFRPKQGLLPPKHGSGCVLSSAITANLAKGFSLHRSCLMAKNYITNWLNSNGSLLGYHKI